MLLTLLASAPLWAQSKWKVPERIKDKTVFVKSPVFPDMQDTPGLPRVLIIGDSISMQYGPEVRRLLDRRVKGHKQLPILIRELEGLGSPKKEIAKQRKAS
jgi:hypothetical protein